MEEQQKGEKINGNQCLNEGCKPIVEDFFDFMANASVAVMTAEEAIKRLNDAGFKMLTIEEEKWSLEVGGSYYFRPQPSMVVAFKMSQQPLAGFRIIGAHTDNPAFKIKPEPEVRIKNCLKLNVERYGGPIFNTWFDRPLSLAGSVAVKSDELLKPRLVHLDFKQPLLTIPGLAIHMNREVNQGVAVKVQKEMQPLISTLRQELEEKDFLLRLLAAEIGVPVDDILDFDLYVYVLERGNLVGASQDFISCPRLDDTSMVYTAVQALVEAEPKTGIAMALLVDNEEIGSKTKQGADSVLFQLLINRLINQLAEKQAKRQKMLLDSFIISADGAHAFHPNYPEKNDVTNYPQINRGVTIKLSASKAYASDSQSVGAFIQLCRQNKLPYQKFVNHSDVIGGKTIGSLLSSYLPIPIVDVGLPMLAMHSARELAGKQDLLDSLKLFTSFYSL